MIELNFLKSLNRKIHQDGIEDLFIPTWKVIKGAIKDEDFEKAYEFLEYASFEAKQMHDILAAFTDIALTHIVKCCGEEEIIKVFRERYYERAKELIEKVKSPEEALQSLIEQQRAHFGEFTVKVEPGGYVVRADPCGVEEGYEGLRRYV